LTILNKSNINNKSNSHSPALNKNNNKKENVGNDLIPSKNNFDEESVEIKKKI
jgi:hypothetical protein